MPEYLSPGVYIEEMRSGPRPIEGVGTAMAAFIGFAPSGPANTPVLITSWTQYVETFASLDEDGQRTPHMPGAYLSHAVYGYFLNGGGRCYVTRIVPPASQKAEAAEVALPSRASGAMTTLFVRAKGAPTSDIQIEVTPAAADEPEPTEGEGKGDTGGSRGTTDDKGEFTLRIRMGNNEPEVYPNVSMGRRAVKNVIDTVNQASRLVTLAEGPATGTVADRTPNLGTYVLPASQSIVAPRMGADMLVGDAGQRSGVHGMEIAEEVTMICCPDLMAPSVRESLGADGIKTVQLAMIAHCEKLADRMAILDAPPDLSPQEAKRWRERDTNYDSKFAALYYPWLTISVAGADGAPSRMEIPPCGHIAGIYARNDQERGVHKAPANEEVRGILSPALEITKGEQEVLNPIGVNCIRSFTGRGVRVWGARTQSSDPAWRYVNVRRLFNYVEKSIERGTQWVVFEPNNHDLWARVRRDVSAFLTGVWRDGMLFGLTPEQAFYVKCDEELNPPDVRDRGQLIIEVGLAPVKPAEFVIFRFSQFAGGGA
jgi:hypothetical protein